MISSPSTPAISSEIRRPSAPATGWCLWTREVERQQARHSPACVTGIMRRFTPSSTPTGTSTIPGERGSSIRRPSQRDGAAAHYRSSERLNRFARYDATHGLNSLVMGRQFNQPGYTFPDNHRRPDQVDDERSASWSGRADRSGDGRGETDDATFVWLPEQRILISGDFVIWVFPNAGNPRKVQRYRARLGRRPPRMQDLAPAVLIPGHGPVVFGQERAAQYWATARRCWKASSRRQ